MPVKIDFSITFRRDLKHLARKYPRVLDVVNTLMLRLQQDSTIGDVVPGVGYEEVYKVRLPNPDARSGKSGGFRLIYYVRIAEHIAFITIYSKTERTDIAPDVIRRLIEAYEAQRQSESKENSTDESEDE